MEGDRAAALQALNLVEGMLRDNAAARSLLADAFDTVEDAARSHAYLAGFLLALLANARDEDEVTTAAFVRRLLARD